MRRARTISRSRDRARIARRMIGLTRPARYQVACGVIARRALARSLAVCAFALTGCAAPRPAPAASVTSDPIAPPTAATLSERVPAQPLRKLRYRFELDADFRAIRAQLCFDG